MAVLLNYNDKCENNGTNDRGRLTASEFNGIVNAVNGHTTQLGELKLRLVENETIFEGMSEKDEQTVYFVLEE